MAIVNVEIGVFVEAGTLTLAQFDIDYWMSVPFARG